MKQQGAYDRCDPKGNMKSVVNKHRSCGEPTATQIDVFRQENPADCFICHNRQAGARNQLQVAVGSLPLPMAKQKSLCVLASHWGRAQST